MRSSRTTIGATALALAAAIWAGCGEDTDVSSAATPRGFHGVVTQSQLRSGDFARMGGKVGTLRMRVDWNRIEPNPGSPYQWSWLDSVVGDAARQGVRVLPALDGPRPGGRSRPPATSAARRAYADFAGAVAARYGREGDFWDEGLSPPPRMPITAYQIYNEQNGRAYWNAKPSPSTYGKLVKAAARRITAQDRRAEVVLGGMFATPSGRGSMTSWKFLSRLYGVNGIRAAFDTVAVHPYAAKLPAFSYQIKRIRDVMARHGDRRAGLRVTEFGWGSARRGGPLNVGRQGQARMLKKSFRLLERKRRAWKIRGANWFAWQDNRDGGCYFCPSAGLFTQRGDAKPSWRAFKRIAR